MIARPKITREEPEGPLRTGLKDISVSLGRDYGGGIFADARNLANAGLDLALSFHHEHGLGDPDRSIPPTYHSIAELRKRGTFGEKEQAVSLGRL